MKNLMMTVAMLIGMMTATLANEKDVKLTMEDNKLHYNYYSPQSYEGIVVDRASKLVLVTDNGIEIVLSPNEKVESQKGYHSESLTVSFELNDCEVELLSKREVVETRLQHANGMAYYAPQITTH